MIAAVEDNKGEISHVHKKDADEAKQLQSGEDIMQLFLIKNCRVEIILLFSKRVVHNSTHTNA